MTQVTCDCCNMKFEIGSIQTRTIERDIRLVCFTCTHCQHEYKSYYTNNKIRTRQEKINGLFTKVKVTADQNKVRQIMNRIDELKEQNLNDMQQLRERFEASK